MNKENKIPLIRFKGYTEDWEQRKFYEIFNFMQNNALSRAELSNDYGEVMNVHYGDILVKYGEILDVKKDEVTYLLNSELLKKYQTSVLQNGDIIIADAAEDETVGKCSEITGLSNEIVLSGLHTIPCRPKEKYAKGYLGFYMNSNAYHDQLLPLLQGTKVSSISKSAIQDTNIVYPKSETEQAKIGSYFQSLDNLITLHQRKCESLKKVKKSMLQKMFPKNGESVPEIRFAGFTDDWEQRKLGEMMNVTSVKRIHQSDWTSSGVRFLRARDIVAAFKNEEPSDYLYISEEKYNEYSSLSGKVKIGDLLVTGVGTIGVPMLINSEKPLYFKDGNIIWFQNGNEIDGDFFYYSFTGNSIQNFIQESAGTGTVGTYTIDSGKKTPIVLPQDIAEQQQIGTYFQSLDNLITLHQRKVEKLKNIKKSMLQKMFV